MRGGAVAPAAGLISTVGVVLPDLSGEFFSEILRGMSRTAQRRHFQLLVAAAADAARSPGSAARAMAAHAMQGRVDGLIVWASDPRVADTCLPRGVPAVLLNCRPTGAVSAFAIDHRGGARAAVRHLAALGHRQLATIAGPATSFAAGERLRGYRDSLRAVGVHASRRLVVRGDFTKASGYHAAKLLVQRRPRPTAIFAANDAMAIGALSALAELGFRVPGDVAVVGFDDVSVAQYTTPRLSTARVEMDTLGERAMACLLDALSGAEPRQEVVAATLVVRESCGARWSETPGVSDTLSASA